MNRPSCPWENAEEAITTIRQERRKKVRETDEAYPEDEDEGEEHRWLRSIVILLTKQDEEDKMC